MCEPKQNMSEKLMKLLACLMLINKMAAVKGNLDDSYNNLTNIDYYGAAQETQHTYCKIATEELQATANATITRELKGVCTSKELKKSTNTILREIQTLKDALIIQVASTAKFNMANSKNSLSGRNKRKNLLNNFDSFQNTQGVGLEQMDIEKSRSHYENIDKNGKYSYYWTIIDANANLYESVSLISPQINYEGITYYLRLSISDHSATIKLEENQNQVSKRGDHNDFESVHISHKIFVLNVNNSKRDLCLDSTNNYKVSLRRLRQFTSDSNAVLIKLVMY